MKNFKISIFLVFIIFYCLQVEAQDYKLNHQKSSINWIGKAAFNSYAPKGTIKAKSGTLKLEGEVVKELVLIIDMKSLHHSNKDLKSHLRNKDFFEVKKYTKASFVLVEPVAISKNKTMLVGDMTIKNSKNKERILVTIQTTTNEMKISYEVKIDRTKYGVKFNSPSFFKKLKENAIADEFKIKGVFVFTKL